MKPETEDFVEVNCDNDEDREDDFDDESGKATENETPKKEGQEVQQQPRKP